jgi:hypothetical protein
MNKKEIKTWVDDAIKRRLDWEDVIELAEAQGMNKKEVEKVFKIFNEENREKEGMELSFFQKLRLKRLLRRGRKEVEKGTEKLLELSSRLKDLDKDERNELKLLKEKMILSIVGDKKRGIEGLNHIFDVTDDKSGKEITRRELEKSDLEDVADLLEDLLDKLEKEI